MSIGQSHQPRARGPRLLAFPKPGRHHFRYLLLQGSRRCTVPVQQRQRTQRTKNDSLNTHSTYLLIGGISLAFITRQVKSTKNGE